MPSQVVEITIDPGTQKLGVAVWRPVDLEKGTTVRQPIKTATFRSSKKDYMERVGEIAIKLEKFMDQYVVLKVYCEQPQFFTEQTSHAAMVLNHMVGSIHMLVQRTGAEFESIKVTTWKGQLPKQVVQKRMIRILGEIQYDTDDEWDAVGIGLYVKGVL